MDTVTSISCNLGGEFFDTTCAKLGDGYQVQGTFKICDPDIFGKFNVGDMIVPLPDMLIAELRSGTYESGDYLIDKAVKHLSMGF
jgi:hypothetical protein